MKPRLTIFTLLLFLSVFGFRGYLSDAAAQQTPASPHVLPETDKIRAIGVAYSPGGEFSRFVFVGEDGKSHHRLEVWKAKNNANPNIVNYVIQPKSVITRGRGPILVDAFHRQCFPSHLPKFEEKDYWVATLDGLELKFVLLDKEEDQNIVKGIFLNLQAAATQSRAGGLLNTVSHMSMWETNVISRFQKGKRQWIKPEWGQPLTVCIRIAP